MDTDLQQYVPSCQHCTIHGWQFYTHYQIRVRQSLHLINILLNIETWYKRSLLSIYLCLIRLCRSCQLGISDRDQVLMIFYNMCKVINLERISMVISMIWSWDWILAWNLAVEFKCFAHKNSQTEDILAELKNKCTVLR